jgi:oligoribonuclease (3'-5' exoribonuclease)
MTSEAPRRYLYCWFDTEYTTLEIERAKLLEVALVVTDDELRPLSGESKEIPAELLRQDGLSACLAPPSMEEVSFHVKQNYQPLLERCRRDGRLAEEIDRCLSSYMDAFPECRAQSVRDRPVLAGNSICNDYFLARRYLPRFLSRLNYRLFDVTTLKLEWLFHYRGEKFQKLGSPETIQRYYRGRDPVVGDKHDAYYDVQASIAELAFYRSLMTTKKR